MYKKIYTLLLATLLLMSSCSFLEEQSQSEVIPRTTADFSELLLGSAYQANIDPLRFLNRMDDDIGLFFDALVSPVGSMESHIYYAFLTWQPYSQDFNGLMMPIHQTAGMTAYFNFYRWIMGANAVLDLIDTAIGTQDERDRITAEALALRAFHYFRLVNLFGEPFNHNPNALGVPIVLESAVSDDHLPRNTVREVYAQIEADLLEAIRLIENQPISRGQFRINLSAMHIILSRVYLFMDGEYLPRAVEQATKALAISSEMLDLTTLDIPEPGTSLPSILLYSNPEVQWILGATSYQRVAALNVPLDVRRMFDVDTEARTGDARGVFALRESIDPNMRGRMVFHKLTTSTGELLQGIRTPEAFLNRAEANALLGNLEAAAADLNTIRRNRIFDFTPVTWTSQTDLVEQIRHERRLEFIAEHHRWFDLRRYGMHEMTRLFQEHPDAPRVVYTLQTQDPMWTLPFPSVLIESNTNLVQNPSRNMPERVGVIYVPALPE